MPGGDPYFYAFDRLWHDDLDLRELPLVERKARLKAPIPHKPSRVLYMDQTPAGISPSP